MSSAIRTAVVGAGHMGRHHARILKELSGAALVAVVDRDLQRAQEHAKGSDAVACQDIREVIEDVDAAIISVPTVRHVEVASPLIERKIPVLIEKPIAASVEEARDLVALAERFGTLVQVGHSERFNPVVSAFGRMQVAPKFIEVHRISPFTFRSADIGVIFDMMIHDIDIVLNTVHSKPARIDAVGINVLGPNEDIASARVVFENGCVVNLTASRLALKTERKIRIFSQEAYLSLDCQKKIGLAVQKDANLDVLKLAREKNVDDLSQMQDLDFGSMVNVEPLTFDDVEPLRAELEAFLNSIRTGTPPAVSAQDGADAVQLAHDILESVKSHRWEGTEAGPIGLAPGLI